MRLCGLVHLLWAAAAPVSPFPAESPSSAPGKGTGVVAGGSGSLTVVAGDSGSFTSASAATDRSASHARPGSRLPGLAHHGLLHRGLMNRRLMDRGLMYRGLMDRGLMYRGLMDRGLMDRGLMDRGLMDRGLLAVHNTASGRGTGGQPAVEFSGTDGQPAVEFSGKDGQPAAALGFPRDSRVSQPPPWTDRHSSAPATDPTGSHRADTNTTESSTTDANPTESSTTDANPTESSTTETNTTESSTTETNTTEGRKTDANRRQVAAEESTPSPQSTRSYIGTRRAAVAFFLERGLERAFATTTRTRPLTTRAYISSASSPEIGNSRQSKPASCLSAYSCRYHIDESTLRHDSRRDWLNNWRPQTVSHSGDKTSSSMDLSPIVTLSAISMVFSCAFALFKRKQQTKASRPDDGQEEVSVRGPEEGQEEGPEDGQEGGPAGGPEDGQEGGPEDGQEEGSVRGPEEGQVEGPEDGQEGVPVGGPEEGQARLHPFGPPQQLSAQPDRSAEAA